VGRGLDVAVYSGATAAGELHEAQEVAHITEVPQSDLASALLLNQTSGRQVRQLDRSNCGQNFRHAPYHSMSVGLALDADQKLSRVLAT